MKTRRIIALLLAVTVLVTVASCKKNRFCHCVTTEGDPDTVVVTIDRGMKCEHILQLGIEVRQEGQAVNKIQNVSCVELDMDTVATIPPRPEEEE